MIHERSEKIIRDTNLGKNKRVPSNNTFNIPVNEFGDISRI
jgi:hypothetical protein